MPERLMSATFTVEVETNKRGERETFETVEDLVAWWRAFVEGLDG